MSTNTDGNGAEYTILVDGLLSADWSDWFAGLRVLPHGKRETIITGWVPDQAALFAILARLQALNVALVSVQRLSGATPAERGAAIQPP